MHRGGSRVELDTQSAQDGREPTWKSRSDFYHQERWESSLAKPCQKLAPCWCWQALVPATQTLNHPTQAQSRIQLAWDGRHPIIVDRRFTNQQLKVSQCQRQQDWWLRHGFARSKRPELPDTRRARHLAEWDRSSWLLGSLWSSATH